MNPKIEEIKQRILILVKTRKSLNQVRYTVRSYVDNDLLNRSIVYSLDEMGPALTSHWTSAIDVILHHTYNPMAKRLHLNELRLIINLPLDMERVLYEDEDFDGTIH